jgi:hypothetical protein
MYILIDYKGVDNIPLHALNRSETTIGTSVWTWDFDSDSLLHPDAKLWFYLRLQIYNTYNTILL